MFLFFDMWEKHEDMCEEVARGHLGVCLLPLRCVNPLSLDQYIDGLSRDCSDPLVFLCAKLVWIQIIVEQVICELVLEITISSVCVCGLQSLIKSSSL